jgi:hypothetical protein
MFFAVLLFIKYLANCPLHDWNFLIGMYWMSWKYGICLLIMLAIDVAGEVSLLAHGKLRPSRTALYMLELWKHSSRKGIP